MSTTPCSISIRSANILNAPIKPVCIKPVIIPKSFKPSCVKKLYMSSPLYKKYKRTSNTEDVTCEFNTNDKNDLNHSNMREFSWDDIDIDVKNK